MREIVVHPSNANILLIATSQGVFRTSDGGTTWQQVVTGRPNGQGGHFTDSEWRGLVFHPTNPDTVYASGRDVFVSADAGTTWTSMTNHQGLAPQTNRVNLAVTPAAPQRLYVFIIKGLNRLADVF